MPAARITASEIGTSMLSAPRDSAFTAEEKNGRPAKAMAGRPISAEIQWNRSRVAASAPDHTETDRSMMLPAANPAIASAINSARPSALCASASADGSHGRTS